MEKLNHDVYTCAEINRREHGSHLEMGNVNDYVVSGEHSAFLLAQAALNPGVMEVFTELLSFQFGNQFYRHKIGAAWDGKTFFELMVHLKEAHAAILIAVTKKDGDTEKKHAQFVERMLARGYTERQVRRLVEWYMRVKQAS